MQLRGRGGTQKKKLTSCKRVPVSLLPPPPRRAIWRMLSASTHVSAQHTERGEVQVMGEKRAGAERGAGEMAGAGASIVRALRRVPVTGEPTNSKK
jgi:hypothetical protein